MQNRLLLRPLALLAVGALASLSCGREVTGPDGAWVARGFYFLTQVGPGGTANSVASELVPVQTVRVVLTNSEGAVKVNRVVSFAPNQDEIQLSIDIPLDNPDGEILALTLAYANAAGDTVFRGGPVSVPLLPTRPNQPPPTPPLVDLDYVGPGSNATRVGIVAPDADTLLSGDAFAFTAVAYDAQDNVVAGAPIAWRSLDVARATMNTGTTGEGVALPSRGTARIEAYLLNSNSQPDTALLEILPRAGSVELASGNNQSALVSTALTDSVVVRVRATDNLPMAGVPVTFVAGNGGTVNPAAAISDANGLAWTRWTLGATAGAQSLSAAVGGVTGSPVTFAATATAPVTEVVLLHHFPFNGDLGATVGTGGGTLFEGASFQLNVLDFDGVDDYVQLNGQLVPTTGSFSISFFARNRTPGSTPATYLSQGTAASGRIALGQEPPGRYSFFGAFSVPVTVPADNGLFNHIVWVVDRTSSRSLLYVNGVLRRDEAAFIGEPGGSALRLGRDAETLTGFWNGQLDDLRIYSGALDAATINTLYTDGMSAPNRFSFTVNPTATGAGATISPAVCVTARDPLGRDIPYNGTVTMSIGANPGGATLGGTTSANATAGVACFSDLSLSAPGSNYTLLASASGFVSAASSFFTVTPPAEVATQLVFTQPPVGGVQNAALTPAIVVEARTVSNALATDYNGVITVALAANPGAATLGGTLAVAAVNGVATFSNLSLNVVATGYTLSATASGLSAATSPAFDITNAAVTNSWVNASGGDWSVPSNWSQSRLPIATDTVAITLAGTYTVMLDQNFAGALILLGGASGTQTLASADRTLSTTLGLRVAPNGVLTIQGGSLGGGGLVEIDGTVSVERTAAMPAPVRVDATGLLAVRSYTLGGSTQLTVANGFSNFGTIELNAIGGAFTTTLAVTNGTLVNEASGTIRPLTGAGGTRQLNANLDNSGLIDLASGGLTVNKTSAQHVNRAPITLTSNNLIFTMGGTAPTFTNLSQITIPASRTLSLSSATLMLEGGSIVGDGNVQITTADVSADAATLDAGLVFSGVVNFTTPLVIPVGDSLRLRGGTFGGPGITVNGTLLALASTTMTGPLVVPASGHVIVRGNAAGSSFTFTVANGFTNEGLIELTSETAGYSSTLAVTNGVLVNAAGATIRSLAGSGGARVLTAALDNSGTLDLPYALTINGPSADHVNRSAIALTAANLSVVQTGTTPSFTNLGSISLSAGRTLTVDGGTLGLSAGTLVGTAGTLSTNNVSLLMSPASVRTRHQLGVGTTFPAAYTIPAGDSLVFISGSLNGPGLTIEGQLVLLGAVTLNTPLTSVAGSDIRVRGSAIGGSISPAVANGFINRGSITLESIDAGYSTTLRVLSGTLENGASGAIRSVVGAGGARTLEAELVNRGSLDLAANLSLTRTAANHVNHAAMALTTANLSIINYTSFTNLGSITLATGRQLTVTGGLLDLDEGTLLGDSAVLSTDGATLRMTPTSVRTRHVLGSSGTTFDAPILVPAGDSLRLISGLLNGPGLTTEGTLVFMGDVTINAPVTTTATGRLLSRATAYAGSMRGTVTNGFTNLGVIDLVADNAGYTAEFAVANGTLVNAASGIIRTRVGAGGARILRAQIDNLGAFDLQAPLTIDRASSQHVNRSSIAALVANLTITQTGSAPSFRNEGNIVLASGRTMAVTGGALDLSPGTLAGDTATLSLSNVLLTATPASARTRFNYGTGTTYSAPYTVPAGDSLRIIGGQLGGPGLHVDGHLIVLSSASVLAPLTTGTSSIIEPRGSAIGGSTVLNLLSGYTNNGVLLLNALDAGYTSTLLLNSGVLVNSASGVVRTLVGAGGARTITATVENDGAFDLQSPLTINGPSAAHVNRALIALGSANLTVTQSGTTPSFTNLGSITMAGGRTLTVSGGALNLTGGTLVGDTATLSITNVQLNTSPAAMRTRVHFNTGSSFTAAYTVPALDSLRVLGGTINGAGLTINGHFVALGSVAIAAPVTTATTGRIESRASALNGTQALTVTNGFTNAGSIELVAFDAGYTSTFAVTNGTLVNAATGSIRALPGAGGARVLAAQLENDGLLDLQTPMSIARASSQHINRALIALTTSNLTVTQTGTTPSFTNLSDITMASGRTWTVTGGALNLSGGTLVGHDATLSLSNVQLTMTPSSARTRLNFGTGSAFTSAYTVPALDSLRLVGGTVNGPSLTVDGRLVLLESTTIAAPLTVETSGVLDVRSSAIGGSITGTVSNGLVNRGIIELDAENAGYNTSLAVPTGTLLNEPGAFIRSLTGTGGSRTIAARVQNQGTIVVGAPLTLAVASAAHLNTGSILVEGANFTVTQSGTTPSFENDGSIVLAAGRTMTVTGGTLDLTAGTLLGDSATLSTNNVQLAMLPATVRTRHSFGTSTTLASAYTVPAGDSLRVLAGTLLGPSLTLSGRLVTIGDAVLNLPLNVDASGSIEVRGAAPHGSAQLTVANGFTNNGLIDLVARDAGYTSTFVVTNGVLNNAAGATIRSSVGSAGSRFLRAALDNSGTLDVLHPLTMDRASSTHIHRGTLTLANANLTITQSGTTPSFTNLGSIQIDSARQLTVSGGAVSLVGGSVTGYNGILQLANGAVTSLTMSAPAQARTRLNFGSFGTSLQSALSIPAGDSLRVVGGILNGPGAVSNQGRITVTGSSTISGALDNSSTGEILVIANNVVGTVTFTAPNNWTNQGLVTLSSEGGSAWPSGIAVNTGTLTNAIGGVVRAVPGTGGGRSINAQLLNQGLVDVQQTLTMSRASSAHVNAGTITVGTGAALNVTMSGTTPSFTNTGGMTLAGTGTQFTVTNGAFNATSGSITGSGTLAFSGSVPADFTIPAVDVPMSFSATTTFSAPLVVPVGQTLRSAGGTINAPGLTVNGNLTIVGATTINAPITTAVGSTVEVQSITLTTPQSWTNTGTLRLASTSVGANPTLTMTGQTLTNAATGTIEMPIGSGTTRILNAATLDNFGSVDVGTSLSFSGGTMQQRGTLTVQAGRTFTLGTLNLLSGSSTTVVPTAQITVGSCVNTGGTIGGGGTFPLSCSP